MAAGHDGFMYFSDRTFTSLCKVSIDEQGRMYFSDPRYLGHEPIFQPGYAVYRLDPDGSVTRIISDGGKANGGWSHPISRPST